MKFLKEVLLEYFEKTLDPFESFANLDQFASNVLEFNYPKSVSFSVSKEISSHFKSSWSLVNSSPSSVGYLSSTLGLEVDQYFVPDLRQSVQGQQGTIAKKTGKDSITSQLNHGDEPKQLFYGRLFTDLHMEALYCRLVSPKLLSITQSVTNWSRRENQIQSQLLYRTDSLMNEFSYNSNGHVFGYSILRSLGNFELGGELYYTLQEHSGGLALGTKYTKTYRSGLKSVTTLTTNPIMGHFESSFGIDLTKRFRLATRYGFNMYSFDSDLSVGATLLGTQGDESMRMSLGKNQLNLSFCKRFGRVLCEFGLGTGLGSDTKESLGLSIEIY